MKNSIEHEEQASRKSQAFAQHAPGWHCDYWHLERAMYPEQVKRCNEIFPKNVIKTIIFDEDARKLDALDNMNLIGKWEYH